MSIICADTAITASFLIKTCNEVHAMISQWHMNSQSVIPLLFPLLDEYTHSLCKPTESVPVVMSIAGIMLCSDRHCIPIPVMLTLMVEVTWRSSRQRSRWIHWDLCRVRYVSGLVSMMSARLRSVKVVELHSTENMRLFSYFFKQKIKKDHFSNKDMRKKPVPFPFSRVQIMECCAHLAWSGLYL